MVHGPDIITDNMKEKISILIDVGISPTLHSGNCIMRN